MNDDADLFDRLDEEQAEQVRVDAVAKALAEWNREVHEERRKRDEKRRKPKE